HEARLAERVLLVARPGLLGQPVDAHVGAAQQVQLEPGEGLAELPQLALVRGGDDDPKTFRAHAPCLRSCGLTTSMTRFAPSMPVASSATYSSDATGSPSPAPCTSPTPPAAVATTSGPAVA